ncbi:hypothetical protein NN561_015134 [Cricetulus griseus]
MCTCITLALEALWSCGTNPCYQAGTQTLPTPIWRAPVVLYITAASDIGHAPPRHASLPLAVGADLPPPVPSGTPITASGSPLAEATSPPKRGGGRGWAGRCGCQAPLAWGAIAFPRGAQGPCSRQRAAWGRHGRGGRAGMMSALGSPVRAYDFLLKFLLVGDSDVGKGEILASLQDGAAESPYGHPAGERGGRSAAAAPGGAALVSRCERPLQSGSSPRRGWAGLGPACWGRLCAVGRIRKAAQGGRQGRPQVESLSLPQALRTCTGWRRSCGAPAMPSPSLSPATLTMASRTQYSRNEASNPKIQDKCEHCGCKDGNKCNPILFLPPRSTTWAVASHVVSQHPGTTPLVWDDMLRDIPQEQLQVFLMGKYQECGFQRLWAASAFKGATGASQALPPVEHHIRNHEQWLQVAGRGPVDSLQGIILTGWQSPMSDWTKGCGAGMPPVHGTRQPAGSTGGRQLQRRRPAPLEHPVHEHAVLAETAQVEVAARVRPGLRGFRGGRAMAAARGREDLQVAPRDEARMAHAHVYRALRRVAPDGHRTLLHEWGYQVRPMASRAAERPHVRRRRATQVGRGGAENPGRMRSWRGAARVRGVSGGPRSRRARGLRGSRWPLLYSGLGHVEPRTLLGSPPN